MKYLQRRQAGEIVRYLRPKRPVVLEFHDEGTAFGRPWSLVAIAYALDEVFMTYIEPYGKEFLRIFIRVQTDERTATEINCSFTCTDGRETERIIWNVRDLLHHAQPAKLHGDWLERQVKRQRERARLPDDSPKTA